MQMTESTVLKQGKIVYLENEQRQQIIWMVCDDESKGVVIHASDYILKIGTISNLDPEEVKPFVGTVNITSEAN